MAKNPEAEATQDRDQRAVIDSATGLPQLEPDQFWRVTPYSSSRHEYVEISIRQRKRFGSRLLHLRCYGRDTILRKGLPVLCNAVYEDYQGLVRMRNAVQEIQGDYPPHSVRCAPRM